MGNCTHPSPTFPSFPGGADNFATSDTDNLPSVSVIYVGGAGNVKVTTAQGDEVIFASMPAGAVVPVQVIRVWSTGTTATNLLRIY